MKWLPALAVMVHVAHAQERVDPSLPDYLIKVVELDDGRVLALGATLRPGEEDPWHAPDPRRVVLARMPAPEVGEPSDIAAAGNVPWVLGTRAVVVADGSVWKTIAIAPHDAKDPHIVALDATHALLLRGSLAELVDAATGEVSRSIDAKGYELVAGTTDGAGGAWVIVNTTKASPMYAHVTGKTWTLFVPPTNHLDDLGTLGFRVEPRRDDPHVAIWPDEEIGADGRGGWFGLRSTEVVHVTSDGTVTEIHLSSYSLGLSSDPVHQHLFVMQPGDHFRDWKLVELAPNGTVVDSQRIPFPAWIDEIKWMPRMYEYQVTPRHIVMDSLLFTRDGTSWQVTYSPRLRDLGRAIDARKERERQFSFVRPSLIAAGSVLGGTLGATAIHGDWRAGYGMLGGTLGALAPQMLLDVTWAPWADHVTGGPGLPQLASGVAVALHWSGFALGLAGATTLGGLGAWEAGKLAARTPPPDSALYGSLGGAAIGTLASVAVTTWLQDRWPERYWLRIAAGSTMIGACASLGYQIGR